MVAIPGIECKGEDVHRLMTLIAMACVTWFLGVKALIYSHDKMFKSKPGLTMDPRGVTLTTFFILLASGLKIFASVNDWAATVVGFVIAITIFVSEYKHPYLID